MSPIYFKVETTFTSVFTANKYARDLRIHVNTTNEKLKFYGLMVFLKSG